MTQRIVLASRNDAKLAELRRLLADPAGPPLDAEFVGAAQAGAPEVAEEGETFADNALAKAHAVAAATGLPAIADDSGLVVDALDGQPGVLSARFAGPHGDDEANSAMVLALLMAQPLRTARFVCVAALVAPDGREWTAEGTLEGHITDEPRGTGGFGYDPIFEPLGHLQTTAEMAPADKDAISHRGQALQVLRPALAELLADA